MNKAQFEKQFPLFKGVKTQAQFLAALVAAKASGGEWPTLAAMRALRPAATVGVEDGWETHLDPAPEGAIVLPSAGDQRSYCGDRWFLFHL